MTELGQSNCSVFVGNIPSGTDSKALQAYFEAFGPVKSASVVANGQSRPQTYGFVSFWSTKDSERLLALTETHKLNGVELNVEPASFSRAKEKFYQNTKGSDDSLFLFMQDIPKDLNKKVLLRYFEQFGVLRHVYLMERKNKPRDFLYIKYVDLKSVDLVKSKKHKIPNLSISEAPTLVCKIGIFKDKSLRKLRQDSKDLLEPYPEQPKNPGRLPKKESFETALSENKSFTLNPEFPEVVVSHARNAGYAKKATNVKGGQTAKSRVFESFYDSISRISDSLNERATNYRFISSVSTGHSPQRQPPGERV